MQAQHSPKFSSQSKNQNPKPEKSLNLVSSLSKPVLSNFRSPKVDLVWLEMKKQQQHISSKEDRNFYRALKH